MEKQIKQCLFVSILKSEYSYEQQEPEQNIQISIQAQESNKKDIQIAIASQIRFETLKNPSKYKPKELSEIKLNVIEFQSQDTKIQKHFKNLMLDEAETNTFYFYLHIYHYQLLLKCEQFKRFMLDAWADTLRIQLKPPNIIEFEGEFKLQQISQLKKSIQIHISQTIVIKWKKTTKSNKQQYIFTWNPNLKNIHRYFDQSNQYIYFYTKNQTQAKDLFKILSNLQERVIDLQTIFTDIQKLTMFQSFYLKQTMNIIENLQITIENTKLHIFGQKPDILEFQRILHFRYINMILRRVQVQSTQLKVRIVNKYITISKLIREAHLLPKDQKEEKKQYQKQAKGYLFSCNQYLKLDSLKQVNIVYQEHQQHNIVLLKILMASYDMERISNVQNSIYNQYDSIVHKIINTNGTITQQMVNQRNSMSKTEADVIIQQDSIIVSGLPKDIQLFEKPFKLKEKPLQQPVLKKQKQIVLRQFKYQTYKIQYQFKMNKKTADRFKFEFQNDKDLVLTVQQCQQLCIVKLKIPEEIQKLQEIQRRILDISLRQCKPTIKRDIHSHYSLKIQSLRIDSSSIKLLNQWGIDYKIVRQLKKVHNKQYEYIHLQSQGNKPNKQIWMKPALNFEQVENCILQDIRNLSQWEYGKFIYRFNTSKISLDQKFNSCIVLATTFKEIDQQTIKLNKYQFMIKYIVRLNTTALKLIKPFNRVQPNEWN